MRVNLTQDKDTGRWYRAGTDDLQIEAGVPNDYRLQHDDPRGWTVLDIGGHIGGCSRFLAERGAAFIDVYEPFPPSYAALAANTARYHAVRALPEAVGGELFLPDIDPGKNTGHIVLSPSSGTRVASVTAMEAADRLLSRSGREFIDFVKIDCEGGEHAILREGGFLDRVLSIGMELHAWQPGTPEELQGEISHFPGMIEDTKALLESAGFEVAVVDHFVPNLCLFRASKVSNGQ